MARRYFTTQPLLGLMSDIEDHATGVEKIQARFILLALYVIAAWLANIYGKMQKG